MRTLPAAVALSLLTAVTQQPIVGSIVKFRPPASLNGQRLAHGQRREVELRVDDRVQCGKGGAVSLVVGGYAADLPCPYDYEVPYPTRGSDPGRLKPGAKLGFSPLPFERVAYSPCSNATPGAGKGAADESYVRYSGLVCDCPAEVENGLLCIDNQSGAAIWYVRVIALRTDASPARELLKPYQQIARGEVWQWYIPVNPRRCVFTVSAEFENGKSAVWPSANLCLSAFETHDWDITKPGRR